MKAIKCYRVWFQDGSAILVNARNVEHAKVCAVSSARMANTSVKRIECLTS